ncbi:MAG: hypothetical protein NTY84_12475 [Verrucomicrobia bacterium]|nr:hypothetical protein [Verrucomicrobiota bacterium]
MKWDPALPVTPVGQWVFFSQFRAMAGLFSLWVERCRIWPLMNRSGWGNESRSRWVVWVWMNGSLAPG